MNQPAASAPIAVCILGMHRSGTSALARMMNLLGLDLGDDLLPGRVDNPKGFWEQRQILAVHAELLETLGSFFDDFLPLPAGWEKRPEVTPHRQKLLEVVRAQFDGKPLWGFKDPRTCRLLPLWHDLFSTLGVQSRFVLTIRAPDEIARSLAVRNGYSYNKSLLLTLTHMLEAEVNTRGKRRAVITYDEILSDWESTASKLEKTLEMQWPVPRESVSAQMAEFLDPKLRHHHSDRASTAEQSIQLRGADPSAARWTFAVYDLLAAAKGSAVDEDALDRIRAEFTADVSRLSAWRELRSMDQKFMQVEAWGKGLDWAVQHLTRENQALRVALAEKPPAPPSTSFLAKIRMNLSAKNPPAPMESGLALKPALENAERDIAALREALAAREALISQIQTRENDREVAQQWLQNEKAAADREIERRDAVIAELRAKIAELSKTYEAGSDEKVSNRS